MEVHFMATKRVKTLSKGLFLSLFIVLFSFSSLANVSNVRDLRASGERYISKNLLVNLGQENLVKSFLQGSYTELEATGLAIVYSPILVVRPWAPTAVRSFTVRFDDSESSQNFICQTAGYKEALLSDAASLPYASYGDSYVQFIKNEAAITHLKFVERKNGEKINRNLNLVTRVVCTK